MNVTSNTFSPMQIWMVCPERRGWLWRGWREFSTFMILEIDEYYRTVMLLVVYNSGVFRITHSFIEDMNELVVCSKKIA